MAAEASSTSRRAWFWVLEILARSDEVDAAVLYDFIARMPQLSGDFGKEAREIVAMRCLESLFAHVNGLETDIQPSEQSEAAFNSSECCENVLQRILKETSLSNLRKTGPDHLNPDVRSFMKDKKAYLPRPALEQLKDTILQGVDPLAAALKRSSGLTVQNQCHQRILLNGVDTGRPTLTTVYVKGSPPTGIIHSPSLQKGNTVFLEKSPKLTASSSKRDRRCLDIKNHVEDCPGKIDNDGLPSKKLKQDAVGCEPHAVHHSDPVDRTELSNNASDRGLIHVEGGTASRPDMIVNDGKDTPPRDFIVSLNLQKGSKVLQEQSPELIVSSSKGERCCLGTDNLVHNYTDNVGSHGKKLTQDAICNKPHDERHSDPLDSTELYKDASERNVLCIEREVHNSAHNVLCMGKSTLPFASDKQVVVSENLGQHVGESSYLQPREPQNASGIGDGPNACVDEAKNDTEVNPKHILLGDGHTDEVHWKTMATENLENNDPRIPLIRADDSLPGKSLEQKNADKARDDMRNHNEGEMSWDSKKFHNEKNDIARKKYDFLSSQQLLNEDSVAIIDWTEKNLCTKCNKGGELLSCSASGCPLVIHESCLGFSATFDNRGKFYCPFCAYSRAISVCLRAKKNATLARKALSQFIGGETSCQPKDHSQRLPQNDEIQERPKEDAHKMKEGNCVDNLVKSPKEVKQLEESSAPCAHDNRLFRGHNVKASSEPLRLSQWREKSQIAVQEQQLAGGVKGLQNGVRVHHYHDAVESSHGDGEPILVRQADIGAGKGQVVLRKRIPDLSEDAGQVDTETGIHHEVSQQQILDQLKAVQQADIGSGTEQRLPQQQILVQDVQQADYGAQIEQQVLQPRIPDQSKDAPCALNNNRNGAIEDENGTGIQHKVLQQILDQDIRQADNGAHMEQQFLRPTIPDLSKDAPCASSNNPNGAEEEENENATASSYGLRRQNREICYTFPATPQLRRKKVAWSAKEEEKLKEGVRRFTDGGDKAVPWKAILEFGRSVFQKGRTAVDLKDKWRNMARAGIAK
ncbi:hypothetical protein Ancab_013801 [Ancistrocladus abbreviatus]